MTNTNILVKRSKVPKKIIIKETVKIIKALIVGTPVLMLVRPILFENGNILSFARVYGILIPVSMKPLIAP